MKKILLLLMSLVLSINAYAFEFDGIDLNDDVVKITRAISARNYVTDPERNCLKGNCQGTEIYMSLNYEDVKLKNKIGQLIVDVPMKEADAAEACAALLNVIYHQVDKTADGVLYAVHEDGTTLLLKKTSEGLRLIYETPYYYKRKK